MNQIEATGRTVEDAVQAALVELGAERDSVHIEVIDEGSKGFLGLLGGKPARVRVSLKEKATAGTSTVETEEIQDVNEVAQTDDTQIDDAIEPNTIDFEKEWDESIRRAKQFVFGIAEKLNMNIDIEIEEADDNIVHLNISGDNVGLIIGRHGQTLDSIQYLTNVVANQVRGMRVRIVLDAEGYRQRRAEVLERLAHRMAERALRDGRKAVLEPMNALERRVIHLALQNSNDVETYSEGEDPYRRVVIAPR